MMRHIHFVFALLAVACLGCSRSSECVNPQAASQRVDATFTSIGKNAQGFEEYRHETTGMVFIRLPGGAYKMGSENGEPSEAPVHEVTVDGFLIGKFEVTQAVWEKVMGANPASIEGDENPVEMISWEDCQEFCAKTGLRLPTEAEWEFACRGGTETDQYWGMEDCGEYLWYAGNSENRSQPVGQKKPNGFGLHDMSGNVWEWCQDWFAEDYYQSSPIDNPKGPDNGDYRVVRGGAAYVEPEFCRSALRGFCLPSDDTCSGGGLRCAADLPR
jgi:formylglycine-generating enzyme required for sulfatase activity